MDAWLTPGSLRGVSPGPASAAHRTDVIKARLTGTTEHPVILLRFGRDERLRSGKPAQLWVKSLPDRRWDPDTLRWEITGLGQDPAGVWHRSGIELDNRLGTDLTELATPAAHLDEQLLPRVRITPGLCGAAWVSQKVVPMADIDPDTGDLTCDVLDLVRDGAIRSGITIPPALASIALLAWRNRVTTVRDRRDRATIRAARVAALSPSMTERGTSDALAQLADLVPAEAARQLRSQSGGVPDWFGLDLYEYQELGALAALAGRTHLDDAPGGGKTRQALAVAANIITERHPVHLCSDHTTDHPAGHRVDHRVDHQADLHTDYGVRAGARILVVVPPVVLTHWARETVQSGHAVPDPASKAGWWPDAGPVDERSPAAGIDPPVCVVVQPGRKVPSPPEKGVVIVADSMLASRPDLVADLADWAPSVIIYDEAHRARTWSSKRSTTMRDLISRIGSVRALGGEHGPTVLPLTGTPMFTGSPVELIPLLHMTGHLDWVFGGRAAFAERFCRRDHFGRWVARRKSLEELRRLLDLHVWVRRHKADILPWLPAKRWVTEYVDVPMAEIRAARTGIDEAITDWLDTTTDRTGDLPDRNEIEAWCRDQIGLLSPLREATGLAKIPVAAQHLESWFAESPPHPDAQGRWIFEEPIVLWAHHRTVISALADQASQLLTTKLGTRLPPVGVIDGATSIDRRAELVADLQAHRLGVLICQIAAAGVGLTLTACASPLFVESDWTAQMISQAEDRHHRPGQTRGVTLTAMCAIGTLDEHMIKVRYRKEDDTALVVGDREGRATRDPDHDTTTASPPWQILAEMVDEAIDRRSRKRAPTESSGIRKPPAGARAAARSLHRRPGRSP